MPDDDQNINIFDYYVDEAGDWDPWVARVAHVTFGNRWDLLGNAFVDTVDTVNDNDCTFVCQFHFRRNALKAISLMP